MTEPHVPPYLQGLALDAQEKDWLAAVQETIPLDSMTPMQREAVTRALVRAYDMGRKGQDSVVQRTPDEPPPPTMSEAMLSETIRRAINEHGPVPGCIAGAVLESLSETANASPRLSDAQADAMLGAALQRSWIHRPRVAEMLQRRPLDRCQAASSDGECHHPDCPQLRDGEPDATGRHCPLDIEDEP